MKTECIVIGAGVIGLAVAAKLSKSKEVLVFERNPKFGEETSSRNSEVIHSGIYYPTDSKKTKWCIEGRERLYRFCDTSHIPFRKLGKYLIATNSGELEYLENKAKHCKNLGVPFEWKKLSEIPVQAALFFPESGIVDSHILMQALESKCSVLYRHEVRSIERRSGDWCVKLQSQGEAFEITAPSIINCGGLAAAKLSNLALKTDRYEHRFCRGRYFNFSGQHPFSNLVYPVPPKDGLGVHVTLDLSGALRLGPDVDWIPTPNYDCDWDALRRPFALAAKKYWPGLQEDRLNPGLIGIRPKLFVDGAAYGDFLVESFDGFVHCLGIESPGLTAALAIAENVSNLI